MHVHTHSIRVEYKHVDVHMCECGQLSATVHMGGQMRSFGVGALVAPCLRWDLLLWHISSIFSWPAISRGSPPVTSHLIIVALGLQTHTTRADLMF